MINTEPKPTFKTRLKEKIKSIFKWIEKERTFTGRKLIVLLSLSALSGEFIYMSPKNAWIFFVILIYAMID